MVYNKTGDACIYKRVEVDARKENGNTKMINWNDERLEARWQLRGSDGFCAAAGILLSFLLLSPDLQAMLRNIFHATSGAAVLLVDTLPIQLIWLTVILVGAWHDAPEKSMLEKLEIKPGPDFSWSRTGFYFLIMWGLMFLLNSVMASLNAAYGWGMKEQVLVTQASESSEKFAVVALTSILLAPVVEELFFRGVMFRIFTRVLNPFEAAVLGSLVFAGLHFSWFQFLPLFAMGMVLQIAYLKNRSMFGNILMHCVSNGTTILLLFIRKNYF